MFACSVCSSYLKFLKLNTQAQQCETVVQGRSLPPMQASVYSKKTSTQLLIKICNSLARFF
ncbi:MAG: hypothetical protein LBJ00_00185 [Planctomycetaceae bacterium]|nr:hypothetical protein [Planctomycetaceae bacterium]